MDELDPAPPPRRPRRKPGEQEKATLRDLKALPEDLRGGSIAAIALGLARDIDEAAMTGTSVRDKTGLYAQLRMAMVTLREIAPGEAKGDETDEVRGQREKRLLRNQAAGLPLGTS